MRLWRVPCLILALLGVSHAALCDHNDQKSQRGLNVGDPIWPPPVDAIERLRAREESASGVSPMGSRLPVWLLPLDVVATPGVMIYEARTRLSIAADSGRGNTRSDFLYYELENRTERGVVTLSQAGVLAKGRVYLQGVAGVSRDVIRKEARRDDFRVLVTETTDIPVGRLVIAGQLADRVWLGVGYEWRRYFEKTSNEFVISNAYGSTGSTERRKGDRVYFGVEYQSRRIHFGIDGFLESDTSKPVRSISAPVRLGFGEDLFLSSAITQISVNDRANEQSHRKLMVEFGLGLQAESWAIEMGGQSVRGSMTSVEGSGSSSSRVLFVKAAFGQKSGSQFFGRVARGSHEIKYPSQLVTSENRVSGDFGLTWNR